MNLKYSKGEIVTDGKLFLQADLTILPVCLTEASEPDMDTFCPDLAFD
jgi:hypothetical protein